MSVDDFIISYFVTGRGVKNLSQHESDRCYDLRVHNRQIVDLRQQIPDDLPGPAKPDRRDGKGRRIYRKRRGRQRKEGMRMKRDRKPFGKILMVLIIVFFYLPIAYMIVFSFNDGKSLTNFTGFSLIETALPKFHSPTVMN